MSAKEDEMFVPLQLFHHLHAILHFLPGFTGYSKSPSPELRESGSDSDEDERDEIFKNPKNEAPTKYRPSFKKYGVKDFKFLRVLGKGRYGGVVLRILFTCFSSALVKCY